jgi:enoyl-[acyl-carrier protein] reductase / trans-2-enoyl-CoA reductase (NAD+)
MVSRVVRPEGKGFIFLDAHPGGCARTVDEMIDEADQLRGPAAGPGSATPGPAVLVIGCSAGYGLAAAVAGLFGCRARVIGLCLERPATVRRSASAGWYRVGRLAERAASARLQFAALNGDCFDPAVRGEVLDRAAATLGKVDVVIYSVAAPRRTDPRSGVVYHSAVKPIGAAYSARNVAFADGVMLRQATLEPATETEIEATVKVMGGEDWSDWITDLGRRGLLAPGFRTVALTYVGSELTAPVYRQGTVGRAKDHLEASAGQLTSGVLTSAGGSAFTSVNCAAVTLSSLAIPGISLYLSLLHDVAGEAAQSPVQQSVRLWDYLTSGHGAMLDDRGRLRLDDWELADELQDELRLRWSASDPELIAGLADADWFRRQIWRLYGFEVSGIDYSQPAELDRPWPAPAAALTETSGQSAPEQVRVRPMC